MAVLEFGIIMSGGLPLIQVDFRKEMGGDPLMRAGFFQAFQDMAQTFFKDEAETFQMQKYTIIFQKYFEFLFYIIMDQQDESKVVKQKLNNVKKLLTDILTKNKEEFNFGLTEEKQEELEKIIQQEFSALSERTSDRVSRLFG